MGRVWEGIKTLSSSTFNNYAEAEGRDNVKTDYQPLSKYISEMPTMLSKKKKVNYICIILCKFNDCKNTVKLKYVQLYMFILVIDV